MPCVSFQTRKSVGFSISMILLTCRTMGEEQFVTYLLVNILLLNLPMLTLSSMKRTWAPLKTFKLIPCCLTGSTLQKFTLLPYVCLGAAGPSGLNARDLCTSFSMASNSLCHSLSLLAKCLCTVLVDPQGLAPFTACRLIALDKNPGVRPIGICETVRCLISKAIPHVVRKDVQQVTGAIQLCAGQTAGIEAAILTTRLCFSSPATEGVLLVDASNTFNSLNRKVTLLNIQTLCPP